MMFRLIRTANTILLSNRNSANKNRHCPRHLIVGSEVRVILADRFSLVPMDDRLMGRNPSVPQ